MTEALVQKYAVRLAASGIAAGAIACQHLAGLCGYENAIGLDMGGTSTDISLVYGGEMRTTKEWSVEYGHPICFPSIEILTIGAGGGSLAWIDQAGVAAQRPAVGRRRPGPGLLRPRRRAADQHRRQPRARPPGQRPRRRRDDARPRPGRDSRSRDGVGEPLGLDLLDAASAVIQVANANMADAVRLISIRRGYDPRDFALVAFGGAGALHGAALARELSIPTVLVPPNPGITSALGCLLVDVRHDLADDVPAPAGRRGRGGDRGRVPQARGRGPRADARGGRARRARDAAAHDRHALPGPVALAGGPDRRRAPRSTRRSRPSTTSTSASSPTAATTLRSRSTSSACARSASPRSRSSRPRS